MLSPKMLKSKFPFSGGGGQGQLLMLSPKMLKSKFPFSGGGGSVAGQLLMLSPKMLKSKFPFFSGRGGGGGGFHTNFQNANWKFLSPILRWNFHFWGGRGGGGVSHQLTFDGEFKFAKIKNFFYKGFFKNFLSFRAKIITGWDGLLEYRWFACTKYRANHN